MSGINIQHVASPKRRTQPFSAEPTDVNWPRRQPCGNPLLIDPPRLGVGQALPAWTLGIATPSTQLGQGAHDSGLAGCSAQTPHMDPKDSQVQREDDLRRPREKDVDVSLGFCPRVT